MNNYILDNLLTSLRELKHADLENGVHVNIATAIAAQVAEVKAHNDALETIAILEFRLDGIKLWATDAFMSAREAKWKGESGEKAVAKILDFINGDRDGDMPTGVAGGFIMYGKPGEGTKMNLNIRSAKPEALDEEGGPIR